jgi:hypothetical protein
LVWLTDDLGFATTAVWRSHTPRDAHRAHLTLGLRALHSLSKFPEFHNVWICTQHGCKPPKKGRQR